MYRYNYRRCQWKLKPIILNAWMQNINHVQFSIQSRHNYSHSSNCCESHLTDLISRYEETVLKNIDTQQDLVDPIEKYLARPTWSTGTIGQDLDSSDSPITDEEVLHLHKISALPPPQNSDQLNELRRDLQSQLSFVHEIQCVNTEGVEPLVCVRNETKEGLRDSTIGLDELWPTLSKEVFVGKCLRPRRREDVVPRIENEWDVFATSENVLSLNGEKYFFVKHQATTSSLTQPKENKKTYEGTTESEID